MTLPIPAAAIAQHVIILGKTRSGKSSCMRLIIEDLFDRGKPVCVLDPKGDWWGLKSSADGKKAGYPIVIFGGDRGDLPLNAQAGTSIAELVATGNRPCIIDTSKMTVADRTRFFVNFAEGLFMHTRGLRWLAIDECHNFAPQGRVLDPESAKMVHWANRLASEGGGKGITLISASQRPQKVHKDYVTSHETLIAMRVIHPLDRRADEDWISGCPDPEKGKEVLNSLASMQRGEGWVWSPEIGFGPKRVQFPMFKTYDSFKPQTAEKIEKLKGWAAVDLKEIGSKLNGLVEEAKANDPKLLKAEITKLRADLTKAQQNIPKNIPPSADALEKAEARGFERTKKELSAQFADASRAANETIAKLRKGMEIATKFIAEVNAVNGVVGEIDTAMVQKALSDAAQYATKMIEKHVERRAAQVTKIRADSERIVETLKALLDDVSPLDVLPRQPQVTISAPAVRAASPRRSERSASSSAGGMSPMARKIVDVLEASYPVSLTFKSAAMRAGASPRSSAFRGYEKEIIASGEVDIVDDRMIAKRHGDALIGDPIEAFAAKLQPSWAAMLRVVANAAAPLSKEEIAAAAGVSPTSSGLNAGLKELCSLALIQRLSNGSYELAAEIREAA